MDRTAIVFGPTGLVGKELVDELINDMALNKVVTVARRDIGIVDPKLEQVIIPDYSHFMQLKNKLDAGVYFCCIGTTIKKAGSQEAFTKVDLEIPKMIAQMADILSINNLVVISSIGANPHSGNFYLRTKGEMEERVRHLYKGNLKIVRPSLLMGERTEFRMAEKISAFLMKIFGWMFIGPLKKYKGITARNVAKAMIMVTQYPLEKVIFECDELHDLVYDK